MAETAYSVIYREAWIAAYERGETPLRMMTEREFMQSGRQAVFLVAASGREMVTRGTNGLIPATADTLTQLTVTLEEKHDLSQKTNFNIFAGQSNQRDIMIKMGLNTLNREIDRSIITALATGTQDAGAPTAFQDRSVQNILTILGNNNVDTSRNIYGLLTPAAFQEMLGLAKATNGEYVDRKVLSENVPKMYRWRGVTWLEHTGLPGTTTSDAKCFVWDQSAIGHAMANGIPDVATGYMDEQDYYWVRHTVYHGSIVLQNAGIVVYHHDDTVLSAVT